MLATWSSISTVTVAFCYGPKPHASWSPTGYERYVALREPAGRRRRVSRPWKRRHDTGVDAIVGQASAFKHLKTIDVSRNWISSAALARLSAIGPRVVGGDQRHGDHDARYVSVGE